MAGMMLNGAASLLMLLFAGSALYFSWVLGKAHPDPATKWFFRSVMAALILKGVSFVAELVPVAAVYVTGADPMLWEYVTVIEVTLLFLENLAWLSAAGGLLRWAVLRKRGAAG